MSEPICTCHCGGSMFYRHLHSDSCELSRVGEEAPMSPKKELQALRDEVARLKERKDGAYLERNQVVATLAKCFPSGIARTAIDGWDEEWHGCVYIDLPTGQVSWHYHDSQAHLFAGLPPYNRAWDGHSTEEKYQRLAALTPQAGKGGGE